MRYKYKFYRDPLDSLRMKLPEQIDMFSDFIGKIATDDLANEVIEANDNIQKGDKDEKEIMINDTDIIRKFYDFIGHSSRNDVTNKEIKEIETVQKGDKDEEEIMINAPTVLITSEKTSVS